MKYLTNPCFIYIGTFCVPFIIYSLGWSTLYPALSKNLLLFYLLSFIFCLVLGTIINSIVRFKYNPILEFRYNKQVIISLLIFYVLDCGYMGYVPILSYSNAASTYDASTFSFGIPTVHVVMTTFNLFFSFYVFHQYLSVKKKSLLFIYCLTIIPFVILVMRSDIMYIIIGSLYIFVISQKSLSYKHLLRLTVFGLAALYMFGYLGNLRSSNGDSTFIPRNSGVTQEFLDSWIPNEFYWGYLYIASPVASLQNNINVEKKVDPDVESFLVYECIPDFISKKFNTFLNVQPRFFNQLNSFLNVGTIYANSFSYLSWTGMILMFFYLIGLMSLYYLSVSKSETFRISGYAMMFNVIAFGNFSNSIQFSAFSFQLVYPILLSIILYIIKEKRKRKLKLVL